jgi:hypothetical protein
MWSIQSHFWQQLSRVWVTVIQFWIDKWIYWTLWYSAWLHFTVHYYTHTHTHTHTHTLLSTVTSSLSLLGSGFQRWTFPFLWVPEPSLASATSCSQQLPTSTELRSSPLIHKPTNSTRLALTDWHAYNISARTAQKTPFHCCCAIFTVETYLFA